jgi:cyclomaltodextrinase / maltogenic alpha-amylase / neopullulanase
MIKLGKYRHFKGKLYEVIGVAKQSETLEEYVVYKALYDSEFGKNALWVRPLKMFTEKVKIGDKEVNRFEFVGK